MRSRTRTAVVCASVLAAALGGLGVLAGAGTEGDERQPAAVSGTRESPAGAVRRAEAAVEFWSQEMSQLRSDLRSLMQEEGGAGSVVTAEIDLKHGLLRRAAEADQDARLALRLARQRLNGNAPDTKGE